MEKEWKLIDTEIQNTVDKIQNYRLEEGKALEKDFLLRIRNINILLNQLIVQQNLKYHKQKMALYSYCLTTPETCQSRCHQYK